MTEIKKKGLAPPVEFRRMLSWELSIPSTVPVRKKHKKKSRVEVPSLEESSSNSENDSEYDYTVVVVNSDGEEEVYYSAPESPVFSDEESPEQATNLFETTPTSTQPRGRIKSKSKKQKKKIKYLKKKAVVEFLGPLCDLVCEGTGNVDLGGVEVTSHAQVPRLTELCLRRMRKADAETPEQLPYLLQVLLKSDRSQHSMVSTILRWLERQLALPFHMAQVLVEFPPENMECWKLPTFLMTPTDVSVLSPPEHDFGLHVPLFTYRCSDKMLFRIRGFMTGPFLHFINLFFPFFGQEGQSAEITHSLSPAQLATIHYVNNFVQTRYKNLCEVLSGLTILWPGYVYWARGQVKQAVAAFQRAIAQLECPKDSVTLGNHRAAVLNEVGRMLSQFGERELACRFFRESEELITPHAVGQDVAWFLADRELIHPSVTAMEAAVYDCGVLNQTVARDAARLWRSVLQSLSSLPNSFPSYWPLYLAAAESKLLAHSGKVTGINPSEPKSQESLVFSDKRYLEECREFLLGQAYKEPLLHYHLSMVHAMLGHGESSKRSWTQFMERFIHFQWPRWLREENTKFHMFNTFAPAQWYPWQPLVDLLTSCSLKQAPVLKVHWRTRLLHPRYPYYFVDEISSQLADHCSHSVGVRLTEDGYITADIHMDTPPMRRVLLDPYTGKLCFPRDGPKTHFYVHYPEIVLNNAAFFSNARSADSVSLPWPVRVFESDYCVVELTIVSTRTDFSGSYSQQFANHSAWLHYYGSDGSSQKVDVRKLIRKQLREVIWSEIQGSPLKDKESLLDKLFESGRFVGMSLLKSEKPNLPPRFVSWTSNKKQTFKILNTSFENFVLRLESVARFGEATLMLGFSLDPTRSSDKMCSALVFVNCKDSESFCSVKVHCVTSPNRHWFTMVTPSAQLYATHFKHIRFATAVMVADHTHTFMVFNHTGELVVEKMVQPALRHRFSLHDIHAFFCPLFSLGPRMFGWKKVTSTAQGMVFSCDLHFKNIRTSPPFPVSTTVTALIPIPGLLILHTNDGVQLLNPHSLHPVVIDGHNTSESQAGVESIYQFPVLDSSFSVLNVWDVCSVGQKPDTFTDESSSITVSKKERGEILLWSKYHPEEFEFESEENVSKEEDKEYGSCRVGLSVNNRLLVLHVRDDFVKCVLDILLPGKSTELLPMGHSGYIVSATNFLDHFREELYWVSATGQLMGVLPCLGIGPHSFLSLTLPGKGEEAEGRAHDGAEMDKQRVFLYFNDGQGAIACVQLY